MFLEIPGVLEKGSIKNPAYGRLLSLLTCADSSNNTKKNPPLQKKLIKCRKKTIGDWWVRKQIDFWCC